MPAVWTVDGGIQFRIKVQPRASKNELSGFWDQNTYKIRLTAAPVDGKANTACIQLLADVFDCSRAMVTIISGHTSRVKVVEIKGTTLSYALEVLGQSDHDK